jgi:hypothetical protein
MATTSAPTPYTPAQLAAMDVTQRQAYFASLPANQQAGAMSAFQGYRQQANRNYMRTTLRKFAVCPPQSGNALSQTYASGQTLTYNVPTAENGFLEGLIFRVSVNLNFATGTSAVYALNPAGVLALIQEIDVLYGNIQMRFRPYILKYLPQLLSYIGAVEPGLKPVAGTTNPTIDAYADNSGTYPVATGNQTWTYEFRVPFNLLHPTDVRGLLPIMSGETTAQVNVVTASTLLGNDPILNPVYNVSGTGAAVTLQGTPGTIQVVAYYRDGVSLLGPARQGLDITGLPTVQWDIDPPLNNLQSGQVFRQKINKAETIAIAILTLVDGVAAGKYSTYNNITSLELDKDSSGTNAFWKFGLGTNLSVNEFFLEIRRQIGQDLIDEGIIPLVVAPTYSTVLGELDGVNYMDTRPSGWTDVNYGIQVGATGVVANARVECHLIFINPVGLIAG